MGKSMFDEMTDIVNKKAEERKIILENEVNALEKRKVQLERDLEKASDGFKKMDNAEHVAKMNALAKKEAELDSLIKEKNTIAKDRAAFESLIDQHKQNVESFQKEKKEIESLKVSLLEKQKQCDLLIEQYQVKLSEITK